MKKHTPGPWKLGRLGKSTQHIDGDLWSSFCKVYVVVGGEKNQEGEANARLIAAAPEMFALLEECEKHMIISTQADMIRLDQIRAAIAKARGEA